MNLTKHWNIIRPKLWIAIQEGKIFTPTFVMLSFLLFHSITWDFHFGSWILAILWALPLYILYYLYEYPLQLRSILWLPILFYQGLFGGFHFGLLLFAFLLYSAWTLFGIGTWSYQQKLGISQNFRSYWKLLFSYSGPTSENVQEQLPKIFLLLLTMQTGYTHNFFELAHLRYLIFLVIWIALTVWLHHKLASYPKQEPQSCVLPSTRQAKAKRVIAVVMEGCRKDILEDAYTPFMDWLEKKSIVYRKMETIYPARTLTTTASLYTGAYPKDHHYQMELTFGQKQHVENLLEKMAEKGKRGKLIGPSYFEELWGNEYIEVINDVPFAQENQKTMEKAKELLQRGQLDFLGIHFTAIKWIGKAKGPFSAEYKEQIQELDVQLSLFYKWLEKNGFLTDTVLIITSTHGLSAGGAHGHLDEGERYVPFILHGPMFRKGKQVSIPHQLTSVAPTIAYLLGVEAPKQARGKLMVEEMR